MKRLTGSGFTAAGVLVVALVGGFVGGAVAMNGADAPAPAGPVTLHQVAGEVTPTPTAEAVDTAPEPTRTPEPSVEPAPVSVPEPKVVDVPKTESASDAADRARAEADRAKAEADRAEKVVTPSPAPDVVLPPSGFTQVTNPDGSTSWKAEAKPRPKPSPPPLKCTTDENGITLCPVPGS